MLIVASMTARFRSISTALPVSPVAACLGGGALRDSGQGPAGPRIGASARLFASCAAESCDCGCAQPQPTLSSGLRVPAPRACSRAVGRSTRRLRITGPSLTSRASVCRIGALPSAHDRERDLVARPRLVFAYALCAARSWRALNLWHRFASTSAVPRSFHRALRLAGGKRRWRARALSDLLRAARASRHHYPVALFRLPSEHQPRSQLTGATFAKATADPRGCVRVLWRGTNGASLRVRPGLMRREL